MIREVEQQKTILADLCRRYRVRQLQLFGSAATGAFSSETSDLDFIAEFADTRSTDYADRYFDFAEALERLFNRPVDVLTRRAIRNAAATASTASAAAGACGRVCWANTRVSRLVADSNAATSAGPRGMKARANQ